MFGRNSVTNGLAMVVLLLVMAVGTVVAQEAPAEAPALVEEPAYKGLPVSLEVQDAEMGTVLRSLASFSSVNIVASPRVVGKVTVKLEEVPWEEALAVILRAHSFDYVEENGVYRIDTADELRQEKLAIQQARKQVESLSILHLGMVNLKYANAEEVKTALEKMLTERGNIDVDVRTNSLLVNDVQERVDLITEMAVKLDSETPQVEINARLVDMDVKAKRELGVSWGSNTDDIAYRNKGVDGDLLISNHLQAPALNTWVGTTKDWGSLMMQVEALESDNKANLISNPIITTTDNREAKILVGQKIPLIVSDEAGNAITQLTTIGIMLQVTPHINNENQITLDVHNEVSDLSSQATVQGGVIINTSESDTRVLVENGETAIIAGLIRKVESSLETGVPVLKDIPLLGALFRHSTDIKDNRELVIFVRPTIVTGEYMKREAITNEGEVIYYPEGMSNLH